MGLWFSLERTPGFGIRRVLPSENHNGHGFCSLDIALNAQVMPCCERSEQQH